MDKVASGGLRPFRWVTSLQADAPRGVHSVIHAATLSPVAARGRRGKKMWAAWLGERRAETSSGTQAQGARWLGEGRVPANAFRENRGADSMGARRPAIDQHWLRCKLLPAHKSGERLPPLASERGPSICSGGVISS